MRGLLCLERFSNSRTLTNFVQGGFYFHPSDEDLSPGTPEEKATPRLRFRRIAIGEPQYATTLKSGGRAVHKTAKLSAIFAHYPVEKNVDYFSEFSDGLQNSLLTYNYSLPMIEVNSYLSINSGRTPASDGERSAVHARSRAGGVIHNFR
jgi:hypothetical protein